MQITRLCIRNFKSIREMDIRDIENALILVGRNNTGKTAVLDALRAVGGDYQIRPEDFREDYSNIEITVTLHVGEDDLKMLHRDGFVGRYKRYNAWLLDFCRKFPSYEKEKEEMSFEFVANRDGKIRYEDGTQKNNKYIMEILPQFYHMDARRNLGKLQSRLLLMQENDLLKQMRNGSCMFGRGKKCNQCFSCIGLIHQKKPQDMDAFETAKLLEYKLYQLNLNSFSRKVNENYRKNGGTEQIAYSMNRDVEKMLAVTAEVCMPGSNEVRPIESMGNGMRSIYMLSLLETYTEGEGFSPGIVLVEEPEIFLHPRLQRVSGEILYRLSKKNQVIFSTHSPNLLANFSSRQIRRVMTGTDGYSMVCGRTDISEILDELGYTATDLMNVNFVFIVEGKQDKSRLPLLLGKYYTELLDEEGKLQRVAIITTNSCTNIKTYANLKYMNQIYLRDHFLMIRDGDGEDAGELKRKLCRYYEERSNEDADKLPRVSEKNVLVLKYYSFENYFLNPSVMAALGIVDSEEEFYHVFLEKWNEYLHKLRSGIRLRAVIGHDLETEDDIKKYMEEIKIYLRGHNLYDIFYGRYKEKEGDILGRYIEMAPKEDFKDILDTIDRFVYFESRRAGGNC